IPRGGFFNVLDTDEKEILKRINSLPRGTIDLETLGKVIEAAKIEFKDLPERIKTVEVEFKEVASIPLEEFTLAQAKKLNASLTSRYEVNIKADDFERNPNNNQVNKEYIENIRIKFKAAYKDKSDELKKKYQDLDGRISAAELRHES